MTTQAPTICHMAYVLVMDADGERWEARCPETGDLWGLAPIERPPSTTAWHMHATSPEGDTRRDELEAVAERLRSGDNYALAAVRDAVSIGRLVAATPEVRYDGASAQ